MIKIETFKQLYNAPRCAVFAFVNEGSKKVYVSYSRSLYANIMRLMMDCITGKSKWLGSGESFNDLDMYILETIDNPLLLKYKAVIWCYEMKSRGYSLYNKVRPVRYRTVIDVDEDYKASVYLRTNRQNKYYVKSFDSVVKAEEYCKNTSLEEIIITAKQDLIKDPADVL